MSTPRQPDISYTYAPLFFFAGGGIVLLTGIYALPAPGPLACAMAGAVFLVLFIAFLSRYRAKDRVSVGAAVPAILGPILANTYVEARVPSLEKLLHQGGDQLVQLAFFCSSLAGAVLYMWVMVDEKDSRGKKLRQKVYLIAVVGMLLLIACFDLTHQIGPDSVVIIRWPIQVEAPAMTLLTLCRIVISLLSVAIAVWPKDPEPPGTNGPPGGP